MKIFILFLLKFLVVSDSQSILYSIKGNPLNSKSTIFLVLIRASIMGLEDSGYSIKFLWAPSHVGMGGNEKADILAKSTCKFTTRSVKI